MYSGGAPLGSMEDTTMAPMVDSVEEQSSHIDIPSVCEHSKDNVLLEMLYLM